MNISKVLKFLVAGIVIGAVLFFAGFGVMNLFKKDPAATVVLQDQAAPQSQSASEVIPVTPPTIEVTTGQIVTPEQGTSSSPIKIKPLSNSGDVTTVEGEPLQTIAFGTLTLSTVNTVNSEPVNADFLIENSDSVAIALVKDTSTTTLSLPVGDYKITVNQGAQKVVRFLGVKDGRNGSEVFELDVATLTDEAPSPAIIGSATASVISAANTDVPITDAPTTAVQTTPTAPAQDNSQATVDRDQVSQSTAETLSTTTQAAATDNANNSIQNTNAVGGLRLSALTKQGKRPTTVSFYIQRLNGENVENFKNVKTQQLTLPAGKYKVTAKTNKATLTKQVEVLATKGVHEIFLISDKMEASQQATQATSTNQSQTGSAAASTTSASSSVTTNTDSSSKKPGKLELFAQKASNNSPVKSNFYVQMPNGKMVASKVYVDSIGYKLPAGKYKVIVRATGYKNKTIMLNVRAGQTRREVFKLDASNQGGSSSRNTTVPTPASPQRSASAMQLVPAQNQTPTAYGGLTVNILDNNDAALAADIVITKRDGTLVKRASNVASASFDLPPSEYLIRVTYNGLTTNQQINVVTGKLAIKTISFDTLRMSRQERRRQRRERRERSQ